MNSINYELPFNEIRQLLSKKEINLLLNDKKMSAYLDKYNFSD